MKDTKQFFGEVIDAISTPEPCDLFTMSLPNMDPEEEIPVVGFRSVSSDLWVGDL